MKDTLFDKVEDSLYDAVAITWDGCHKIYVLMDEAQVALMREYEYDPIITKADADRDAMLTLVKEWFDKSCGLRFVNAVSTVEGDPNEGFENLISQFEAEESDEDDTLWCANCGYHEVEYADETCRWCEESDEDEDEDEE